MKTRLFHVAVYAALGLGIPLLAFWFGVRQGAEVALMLDSIPRGGLSLYQLQKLKEGGSTNMATLLESDVDIALISAYRLDHHPLRLILEPLSGLSLPYEDSLVRLANYRRSHPSPLRTEALALEPMGATVDAAADRASLLEAARGTQAMIASTVNRYAFPNSRTEGASTP